MFPVQSRISLRRIRTKNTGIAAQAIADENLGCFGASFSNENVSKIAMMKTRNLFFSRVEVLEYPSIPLIIFLNGLTRNAYWYADVQYECVKPP